jgi:hypothetical protein
MANTRTLTQADANFLQKQFSKVFATKDDLKSFATKKDIKSLVTKIDLENALDKQEQKFENKMTEFRDKFYTKIDPILKEVTANRQERATSTEQHRRNEKRIEKLEKIHPHSQHIVTV